MRTATFEKALAQFSAVRPFEPFTVELVTGLRLISRHPEAIILEGDLAVYVEIDFTVQLFDAASVARLVSRVIPRSAE